MEQVSITSAYMWAIISMVVFLFLAIIVANAIMFKPRDPGTTQRRIWFWVFAIATPVVGFVINYIIAKGVEVPSLQSNYLMHAGIVAGVTFVLYIVFGFAISKMFSNSKVGTWF